MTYLQSTNPVDVLLGSIHHQVDIKLCIGDVLYLPHQIEAQAEIGNKMAIHHVNVKQLGPCPLKLADLASELQKICAHQRWGNTKHATPFSAAIADSTLRFPAPLAARAAHPILSWQEPLRDWRKLRIRGDQWSPDSGSSGPP